MKSFAKRISLGALVGLLLPLTLAWADGRVISVKGEAQIDRGNDPVRAELGSAVFAKDALRTDVASAITVQMADDALLRMGSEGALEIRAFRKPHFQGAEGSDPGEAVYRHRSGTLRIITGLISQMEPQAQRIESDYASIVAHGTDIESTICDAACVANGNGERGQYIGVRAGAVTVSNGRGSFNAGAGDWVYVAPNAAPAATPSRSFRPEDPPSRGPGGSPPGRGRPDAPPRIEDPPPEDPVVSPS